MPQQQQKNEVLAKKVIGYWPFIYPQKVVSISSRSNSLMPLFPDLSNFPLHCIGFEQQQFICAINKVTRCLL